jgi:hypothetical protein
MKLNQLKKFEPFDDKSILEAFEFALKESPLKILYDSNKNYLTYLVEVEDPPSQQSLYDKILELGDIQEVLVEAKEFFNSLARFSFDLSRSNYNIGLIVLGNVDYFKTINDYFSGPITSLLGIKVEELKDFSPETILLLITDKKNPELPDYKAVIKMTIT